MSASDPQPQDDRLYVGQVLAGYRLEGKIGSGGFSSVLRATRLKDGEQVALKLLRPRHKGDMRREGQLLKEGRILQSLRHPRVLPCLDVGRSGGWSFLVLPWIDGQALSTILANGRMDGTKALDCAFQVLEALEYIHKRGIVHQDVKPDNLLLDRRGKCYLCDFGLALTREDALKERASGGVLRIVGSTSYRAPEQETPGAAVGARADIYAFGVTLNRMLTGALPENGAADPSLGDELRGLIERCLSQEPSARPSPQSLRKELHHLDTDQLPS